MSLKHIKQLIQWRKIDEAQNEIEKLQEHDRIEGQIYKSSIMAIKKDYNVAFVIIDDVITDSQSSVNLICEFGARIIKLSILWQLDQINDFIEEVNYCDQILKQMKEVQQDNVKEWTGDLLNYKAAYQTKKGKLNESLDYLLKSLFFYEQIENHQKSFTQLIAIGWIKRVEGELDQALNYFKKSLEISKKMGSGEIFYSPWAIYAISFMYFYKGELNRTMSLAQESLELFKNIKNWKGISYVYTILGSFYRVKGELEQGLVYYNKILKIYDSKIKQNHKVEHSCCLALLNIGKINYEKNQLEKSIEYFKRTIKTHQDICKEKNTLLDFYVFYAYHSQIVSSLLIQDEIQIENGLMELSNLAHNWPTKIARIFYKKAQASVLKSKHRAKFKIEAQQLFGELLEDPFDYDSTFYDQINLCELLLDELKISDIGAEEEILKEIQELLDKISANAKNQRSITTLLVSYSLQAKLALVEGNSELSIRLLNRALKTAENKKLWRLHQKLEEQKNFVYNQLAEWKTFLDRSSTLPERIEELNLKKYISEAINVVLEDKFESKKKFELVYKNLLNASSTIQKSNCRVAIAQIGLSENDDLLSEYYQEIHPNLFGITKDKISIIRVKVKYFIELASKENINILLFPELSIDLNYPEFLDEISNLSKKHNMYIIPGSFHDQNSKQNISFVISPEGILWEQVKHIPATIMYKGNRFTEGIQPIKGPKKTIICDTEFGRIAVIICRDFLDLDLRVELKNFEPAIDLIFNLAFTPVTSDFKAAHFDARRSIYAYCFFANIADFGDSLIYTPEKDRIERTIPAKEESLIIKDVDLFRLRSERKKWEIKQTQNKSFIQSTRT